MARAREQIDRIPDVLLHPTGGAILEVAADDLEVSTNAALTVAASLERAGVRALTATIDRGAPEQRVEIDRARAAAHGIDATAIARAIRLATDGEIVGHLEERGEHRAIRLRAPRELRDARVRSSDGASLPLGEVATFTAAEAPREIRRCGTQRCVRLFVEGDEAAIAHARERLTAIEIPRGVALRWR